MNSERDRLLSDILAEPGGSGELRETLLNRTLRQVKRRRAVRRVRLTGSLFLVPLLALLLWHVYLSGGPGASHHQGPYTLVRTQPMPPSALVQTRPFARSGLVTSAPSPEVATVTTRPGEPGYREIDDATLLALAGTNSAVLVRLGPSHHAELVFASGTMAPTSPGAPGSGESSSQSNM